MRMIILTLEGVVRIRLKSVNGFEVLSLVLSVGVDIVSTHSQDPSLQEEFKGLSEAV